MVTERFRDRCAVVTGAGSGVGRATATLFAAEGAAVVVADIRPEAAQRTVDTIIAAGGRAAVSGTDVSDESSGQAMIGLALEQFGRLDILHNNAAALGADAYGKDWDIAELDLEVWDRTMAVNSRGVLLGCKHAVPAMRRSGGGTIVNTSSVAALHGGEDHAAYGVSKAAIVSITKYVASMYGGDSIRCNAVAPGLIMSETSRAVLTDQHLSEFAAERVLPWAAEPEDIANAVAWLASDNSRCVTGQTIVVDSGTVVRRPRDIMKAWEAVLTGDPPGSSQ